MGKTRPKWPRISEHCFDALDAPVMRVGTEDYFVPSAPTLEEAVLPQMATS